MDDAGLNHSFREYSGNGIRENLQAVYDRQHDIIDAQDLELIHDAEP